MIHCAPDVRTSMMRRLAWGLVILGMGSAGCASSSSQVEEGEQAEAQKKATTAASSVQEEAEKGVTSDVSEERGIPPLREPTFADEAPEVERLATQNGIRAYRVGELKLIYKPTPANSVISTNLYIDGGLANLSEKTAGIEKLALRTAVNGGTDATSKEMFNAQLSSTGSSVGFFTNWDYSGYQLRSTVQHFDETWKLFEEAVLEPAMPESELAVQRRKQLAERQRLSESPNQLAGYLSRQLMAVDHPYRLMHMGTESNLRAFSASDLEAYHSSLLDPERMTMVVVGDVPVKDVLEKVQSRIARLEGGERDGTRPETPSFNIEEADLEAREKSIPTNYILGRFAAPAPGEEDYPAMRLALAYLSDRLFEEIRTKRNLSYAVSAGLSTRRTNAGYIYVSAKQPNRTMKVMFDTIDRLKEEMLDKKVLKRTRNVFVTEHYMDLETNAGQASSLARAELVWGDWRSHLTFLERIRSVTPEDVRRAARTYLKDYQFGVVGQPDQLDRDLFLGGTSTSGSGASSESASPSP